MNGLTRTGKNILFTIAPAVIVYAFFFGLTNLTGKTGFGTGPDFMTILYNMVFSGFIALAMSYNLTSGRLDFSIGSVLILSLIAGGTLAKQWNVGPVLFVLIIVAFGLLCGLVSGMLYVTLRLPAMVTSLGVTMIFEAIAFALNKSKGIRMIGRFDVLIWGKPPYSLVLMGIALIILIYILNYTKFGYNSRSLRTGQKNAVDVGIDENLNAVLSYVIAGGLIALAGVMYMCQYGYIAPQTGLSSSSFMMGAFLPVFIGGALARYSDRNIGVIVGAFIQATISSGIVKMGASSSMKTVIDGAIVLIFLIYLSNSYKIPLGRMYRQKKEAALSAAGKS